MAKFDWGSALSAFGKAAPGVGAAFDASLEKRRQMQRQAMLDPLQMQSAQQGVDLGKLELEEALLNRQKDEGAQEALRRLIGERGTIEEALAARKEAGYSPEIEGPAEPGQQVPFSALSPELMSRDLKTSALKSGALEYADQPSVAKALQFLSPEGLGGEGKSQMALRRKYNTPENRERATKLLSGIRDQLDPEFATTMETMIPVDPYGALQELGKYTGSVGRQTQTFEELMGPKEELAGRTAAASALGGIAGGMAAPERLGAKGISPYTGKPFTDAEKLSGGYALRIEHAIDKIDELAAKGFDEGAVDNAILSRINTEEGATKETILNSIRDPQIRQYANVKIDFIMAVLRKESGAAINAGEYKGTNKQYFGQPNDDPETIAQKRMNRITKLSTEKVSSGGAYEWAFGQFETEKQRRTKPSSATGGKKIGRFQVEVE